MDKIGGDVPKVVSCKAFSCTAYFLTSKINQIKQQVNVNVNVL